MTKPTHIFRVSTVVHCRAADAVSAALEPHLDSIAWTADEDDPDLEAKITGFASGPPDEARMMMAVTAAAAAMGIAVPEIEIAEIETRDWVADNLHEFPPLMAGRFFIHGREFEGQVPAGQIALRVPAAAAFGSGDHGSTQGCLLALDGYTGPVPHSVLDMGCGSGILAIAAAKMFPSLAGGRIVAADIDPQSVTITEENAVANGVAGSIRAVRSIGYRHPMIRHRRYDLIFANILARPLMRMAGDLARHLEPGGTAVLAGLLSPDANRVLAAHRAQGLHLVRKIDVGEWTTLVLRRP